MSGLLPYVFGDGVNIWPPGAWHDPPGCSDYFALFVLPNAPS